MIAGLEPARRAPYNYATHYAKKSRKFIRVWGRFKGQMDRGYRTPVIVHSLLGVPAMQRPEILDECREAFRESRGSWCLWVGTVEDDPTSQERSLDHGTGS